jgi:ParB family chromosome partitioning protein
MKLANISPKLLALLREDAITLDQLSALALADDHETQERILCRCRHKSRYQEH